MKKYVSLAVNDNPKYMYYIPLVTWAWQKFGWECHISYCPENTQDRIITPLESLVFGYHKCYMVKPTGKTETTAQISRLFAWADIRAYEWDALKSGSQFYMLTSDADMLPLSNIWEPIDGSITCYGRDLTDFHYPICYIGMDDILWDIVTETDGDYADDKVKNALNGRQIKWTADQDFITEKLLKHRNDIVHIDRGTDKRTGYPRGRVDRSNWRLDHEQLIDCHMPHDILTNDKSFHKVMELLHLNWPKEDFKWVVEYHKQFKKLI
jgi:hypothetical protein